MPRIPVRYRGYSRQRFAGAWTANGSSAARARLERGGRWRRRADSPPPAAPARSGRARHRRAGAVRPLGGDPAHPRARRRRVCPADVGVLRRLPDAQRRSRGARAQGARRLPGADRPRAWARRAAQHPAAARVRRSRADPVARQVLHLAALAVVLRPPHRGGVHPSAPPRALPGRGRAHVRGLRPRSARLLVSAYGSAVVRGPRGAHGGGLRTAARGAPNDGRVRRRVLGRCLGPALQLCRGEPAGCHAVAALRHVRDGGPPPERGRARSRAGRVELCGHARHRARLPGRALRRRPARRARSDRGRAAGRAAGGSGPASGLSPPPGARGAGAGQAMTDDVVDRRRVNLLRDDPAAQALEAAQATASEIEAGDEEMPKIGLTRRRVLLFGLFVASALAFLYFVLPKLAGLQGTWDRVKTGAPGWLIVAGLLEIVSFGGYVMLFRTVFVRGYDRIGWSASYQITMASLAATRLFASAGAGGVVLTAWALRRSGMGRRLVACRMIAFLVLLYGVFMCSLVIFGVGLRTHVFSGSAPFALTVIPAIFGASVIVIALAMAFLPADFERRLGRWASGSHKRVARVARAGATVPASFAP